MKLIKSLISIGLSCVLSSCLMTDYMRTLQVETLQPAIFNIPKSTDSIGVFNLSPYTRKDMSLEYMVDEAIKKDTLASYRQISKESTKSLVDFLIKENYFKKVRNFGDSLDYLKSNNLEGGIYEKLKVDAFIFLDSIDYKIVGVSGSESSVIVNRASLVWSLSLKRDSFSYKYSQIDTLIFNGADALYQKSFKNKLYNSINSSAEYLGKAFGAKLIPTWIKVERMFYRSNNPEMIKAEEFANVNQWIKAAEIWNKMTRNKNTVMAAKASYNMALACEMEGDLDAAIDWLVRSYTLLKENNKEHQDNCQRYINLLATRKKEIEKLAKQVRSN